MGFIARGYFEGANLLVETLDHNPSNILVYPIVFLYRHFIEIQLKAILTEFQEMGCDVGRLLSHNLEFLLNMVNDKCNQRSLQSLSDEVGEVIQEFNEFDSNSQTFRYSRNRNGDPNIPEHDTLGLDRLKTSMDLVESELYGLLTELRETNKINQEISKENI